MNSLPLFLFPAYWTAWSGLLKRHSTKEQRSQWRHEWTYLYNTLCSAFSINFYMVPPGRYGRGRTRSLSTYIPNKSRDGVNQSIIIIKHDSTRNNLKLSYMKLILWNQSLLTTIVHFLFLEGRNDILYRTGIALEVWMCVNDLVIYIAAHTNTFPSVFRYTSSMTHPNGGMVFCPCISSYPTACASVIQPSSKRRYCIRCPSSFSYP